MGRNYDAIVVRTSTEHFGHRWVVVQSWKKGEPDMIGGFLDSLNTPNQEVATAVLDVNPCIGLIQWMVVSPCIDSNAQIGSLLCENEF